MYGPKYQWLIVGNYPTNWWYQSPCARDEIKKALQGTILMKTTASLSNNVFFLFNIYSLKK
jgi:hypothetical protein